MRRAISMASWSLKADGAERSELSIEIATSALLRAGRVLEPEKITSSMDEARMDLCEDSPITQRSASTRLDLPQPFGPTNDLNPIKRSRVSFILQASCPHTASGRRSGYCWVYSEHFTVRTGRGPRTVVRSCASPGQ